MDGKGEVILLACLLRLSSARSVRDNYAPHFFSIFTDDVCFLVDFRSQTCESLLASAR